MTTADPQNIQWLSLPEAAELLEVELRAVRGMLTERRLLAVRRGENKALSIARDFLVLPGDDSPIPEPPVVIPGLRGTIIQLADAGYDDEETLGWLYAEDEELGETPIAALRAARTHAVRRVAQTLAF
ncbi:DNA-binding protein [Occultella glacieicola]|uniref:DNA-binding protein n=1 Tax=Occultella glacieicola TaxID=2518684 RepID=A0ABY2DXU8_9MICO|nr:Rv2175c family DNA-binding protein [Occultella glacieicola]TDE88951.1 DNA-binding protein [Occultella glacieicola]